MANNDANLELSLRNFLSSGPKGDDAVHAYAEKLGIDPHEFEGKIYNIAFKALSGGYLKHADDDDSQFDADQLKRGIEVEKEHTDDEAIAKIISKAHLSEFPDYYTRLANMEDQAKQGTKDESMELTYKFLPRLLREECEKITEANKDPYGDFLPKHHANAAVQHFKAAKRISNDDPDKGEEHRKEMKYHLASAHSKWFANLSKEQQEAYLDAHPDSKLKESIDKPFKILHMLLNEFTDSQGKHTMHSVHGGHPQEHKDTDWSEYNSEFHDEVAKIHQDKAKEAEQKGWKIAGKHKKIAKFHSDMAQSKQGEFDAKHKAWFDTMSKEKKDEYLRNHPLSKMRESMFDYKVLPRLLGEGNEKIAAWHRKHADQLLDQSIELEKKDPEKSSELYKKAIHHYKLAQKIELKKSKAVHKYASDDNKPSFKRRSHWWASLSPDKKASYIRSHPHSKLA